MDDVPGLRRPGRGALWVTGLLVAAAALEPGAPPRELPAAAKRIAAHRTGARGEARAGFPHVRRALDALSRARVAGATEPQARLDALVTVMSTLQDTGPLYRAGPPGLRRVRDGALFLDDLPASRDR